MKVKMDGDKLVIEIPINKPLKASKTGKSLVVASTGGNVPTGVIVEGHELVLGLNAYVKR